MKSIYITFSSSFSVGVKQPSRGKLERVWPPVSKKEKIQSEQTKVTLQSVTVHIRFLLD